MKIPNNILESMQKKTLDNRYFYNADEMWERLSMVKEKQIPFIRQDMSMLSNVLENYYKGTLEAENITDSPEIMCSHYLPNLSNKIEKDAFSLTDGMTIEEKRNRHIELRNLSELYVGTRYKMSQPTYDDFVFMMDKVEHQMILIKEKLLGKDLDYATFELELELNEDLKAEPECFV